MKPLPPRCYSRRSGVSDRWKFPIMRHMLRNSLAGSLLLMGLSIPLFGQVPAPFPRPAQPGGARVQPPVAAPGTAGQQPPVAAPPGPPAAPAATSPDGQPTESMLGASIYPSAQYLQSYDAGRGQRYYLFGSDAEFLQVVAFYRTALKQKGELIFDEPPVQMFEVGRFREETMAFAPSVTVKDYTWGGSQGYLNPKRGGTPERFRTIIQIVPAPAGAPKTP
jgi:hypothetical protein